MFTTSLLFHHCKICKFRSVIVFVDFFWLKVTVLFVYADGITFYESSFKAAPDNRVFAKHWAEYLFILKWNVPRKFYIVLYCILGDFLEYLDVPNVYFCCPIKKNYAKRNKAVNRAKLKLSLSWYKRKLTLFTVENIPDQSYKKKTRNTRDTYSTWLKHTYLPII